VFSVLFGRSLRNAMFARYSIFIIFVASAEPGEILSEAKEDLIVASDIVQGQLQPHIPTHDGDFGIMVSCGQHTSRSCAECPMGHGQGWCHGDCEWHGEFCVPSAPFIQGLALKLRNAARDKAAFEIALTHAQTETSVSCGMHRADSCDECPRGHGPTWCNGNCTWHEGRCAPSVNYIRTLASGIAKFEDEKSVIAKKLRQTAGITDAIVGLEEAKQSLRAKLEESEPDALPNAEDSKVGFVGEPTLRRTELLS